MKKPVDNRPPSYADLPKLPRDYTAEQLRAWRAEVAKIPVRVVVPPLPEVPSAQDEERVRAYAVVETEQRLQAEAEEIRTDPIRATQRRALIKAEVGQLDSWINNLMQRRDRLIREMENITKRLDES